MDKARIALLVALVVSGCAADGDTAGADDLPAVAARIVGLSPGANYVAAFDVRQLRRDPPAREAAATADEVGIGWMSWAAPAAILRFDPFADASSVAVAASIGSCGVTRDYVLAVPTADAGDVPVRVDGACTIVRLGEYEDLGVTLRRDGSLFLHRTPLGDACSADARDDLPAELREETWLAGAALAQGWQVGAGGETPAVIEAMPGEAKVTWLGGGPSP